MATFGPIASAAPNVLFDPGRALSQAGAIQRNQLMMQNEQQDQQAQTFERDANARIALARKYADAPDGVSDAEWAADVQRMQAAGFGHGIDPSRKPPRERLQQIAASDLTTFQRLQIDEKRRQTEALAGLVPGAVPGTLGVPGGAPVSVPVTPGGRAPAGNPLQGPIPPEMVPGADTPQLVAGSAARTQSVGQPLYNPARPAPGSVPGIPGRWDEGLSPPTGVINPNIGGGGGPAAPAQPAPVPARTSPDTTALQAQAADLRAKAARAAAIGSPAAQGVARQLEAEAAAIERRMSQGADDTRADLTRQDTLAHQRTVEQQGAARLQLQKDAEARDAEKARQDAAKLPPKVVELVAETEDKLQGLAAARGALDQALKLSPQAYAGMGAEARGSVAGTTGFDTASGTATTQFKSLMTEQVVGQLKTIFGGNPTEGERNILTEMTASASMSRDAREKLIDRAQKAVAVREAVARERLTKLRRGEYGQVDPNYSPPPPAAETPDPAAGGLQTVTTPAEAHALKPGTRYRTPDGRTFVR